ncbi:hypothetical protein Tco_0680917 [Tanacetum coccineum]|uniref:Uncharacterized protein n=1 Tax=Tanacetum coccineum TaxID=301880 RepID=A0ABQ4XN23_9ASTR
MLEHKKKQKEEKPAMEEEMENLRKQQTEDEIRNKAKEKAKRAKQQAVAMPRLKQVSSSFLLVPETARVRFIQSFYHQFLLGAHLAHGVKTKTTNKTTVTKRSNENNSGSKFPRRNQKLKMLELCKTVTSERDFHSGKKNNANAVDQLRGDNSGATTHYVKDDVGLSLRTMEVGSYFTLVMNTLLLYMEKEAYIRI